MYNFKSHSFEPSIGDSVQNNNPKCKHYGSEGVVLKLNDLPRESGKTVEYICTNDGAEWSSGDVLTKTLDQLCPLKTKSQTRLVGDKQLRLEIRETIKKLKSKKINELFGSKKEKIKDLDDVETVGELLAVIQAAQKIKKGEKLGGALKDFVVDTVVDELVGKIPGAGLAKGLFGIAKSAYGLDDNVQIGKGLSFLNVDDDIAAIVDDPVENRFLADIESELSNQPEDKMLADLDITKALSKFLEKEFNKRTVAGYNF